MIPIQNNIINLKSKSDDEVNKNRYIKSEKQHENK